jgi:formylglycine-generating enzyme required for sulfatase activity
MVEEVNPGWGDAIDLVHCHFSSNYAGMLGNLLEWCWDRYGTYPSATVDPSGATSGTGRVLRGGLWYAGNAVQRAADRESTVPSSSNGGYGFRLVRTIP